MPVGLRECPPQEANRHGTAGPPLTHLVEPENLRQAGRIARLERVREVLEVVVSKIEESKNLFTLHLRDLARGQGRGGERGG